MMKAEYFLQIISKSNSIKVSFNVPVKDNYSSTYPILIHNSNFFASDRHVELHNRKKDLLDVYEDLSAAFITISKLF